MVSGNHNPHTKFYQFINVSPHRIYNLFYTNVQNQNNCITIFLRQSHYKKKDFSKFWRKKEE